MNIEQSNEDKEKEVLTQMINKIIKRRKELGISQSGLAQLIGVTQPALARIESQAVSPRVNTIIRMMIPLGMELTVKIIEEDDR